MQLYNKYRPQTLDQLVGNSTIVDYFTDIFDKGDPIPQAILLHGQTGCGKTTIARILANYMEVDEMDYTEINSANLRGIDTVRNVIEKVSFRPIASECRMWVFDEVHKLTNEAQNAMLKLLEDPLNERYFIFCTTDPQKLLPTVRGRCINLEVSPLSDTELIGLLRTISKKEKVKIPEEILELIAIQTEGKSRNAIQILESIIRLPIEKMEAAIKQSILESSEGIELCRALLNPKVPWKKTSNILQSLKEQKVEPESIRRMVLGYAESTLLKGGNKMIMDSAANMLEEFSEPVYDIGFPGIVLYCYSVKFN